MSIAMGDEASSAEPLTLDFRKKDAQALVSSSLGRVRFTERGLSYLIPAGEKGLLEINPRGEFFNVYGYTRLDFEMASPTGSQIRLFAKVLNEDGEDWKRSAIGKMYVSEKESKIRPVYLFYTKEGRKAFSELSVFKRMNGLPGGAFAHWQVLDTKKVKKIIIQVFSSDREQNLELISIKASHPVVPTVLKEKKGKFFPFIDSFGQYIHDSWPGKIRDNASLKKGFHDEEKDLEAHPGPTDRNKWGGWKKGPKLKATGFFRTEKRNGKWWLVDPDGFLFWSHGVTGVGSHGGATPVTGREHYFEVSKDDPHDRDFFVMDKKRKIENFDFTGSNLKKALGERWKQTYLELSHQRLASWGMNTLGNWSSIETMQLRKTPYTVAIHYSSKRIHENFPDPFSEEFRLALRTSLENKAEFAGDPWNLGYFVDNELHFHSYPMKTIDNIITGSPEMSAKKRFVSFLGEKINLEKFNALSKSSFSNWNALLQNRDPVDLSRLKELGLDFYRIICETYFRTCREEVKRIAPNQLYLGCRFNRHSPLAMTVAGEYCDVISYNLYRWDIDGMRFPKADKPYISTEFHFGAQDRGMFGLGLKWAANQDDRAKLYSDYVEGALKNPQCVGTHWFQYNSQAFTGRKDGENYQVGLTDIGGRPWPELRDTVRDIGTRMYQIRSDNP